MRRNHPNVKIQLAYGGLTSDDGKWTGKVRTVANNLGLPLRVKKPTAWAVWNDLFHKDVPEEFISNAFAVMYYVPRHVYIILTKRPERMLKYFSDVPRREYLLPNVWLGVTAENREQADKRIPILLSIPASVRFVSIEPMLEPVDLSNVQFDKYTKMDVLSGCGVSRRAPTQSIPNAFCDPLDWVICGGETGARARPCHPDWVRRLRDACQVADTPFFFKGFGRKAAGRLLNGHEWNEIPQESVSDR